ncbi:tripartite tricarboxylate transporter substrate binding protein [Rhodovarius crocodyli]|uniref:Tripartite tricarboxylate transporter substrate binding protein n=1 Tax=Rhodovarius crocodyli TaxID=1979269 RepID=A0A437MPF1_9PROT|nr:tripartite tricarboxylate transporter substrate binding protein [Rhodovarius crocodyli]RVT99505.1 tripartite tricarboxylate transporter substrate binding protein [Rhodovarius crocodyli]
MPSMSRRAAIALPLAGGLCAPAFAQGAWRPDRPIRLIVPWPPGGSADAQLRSLSDLSTRVLGQPMLVENRSGAGGTLHATYLAREARPDGYTLGQMHLSVVRRPLLVSRPQWDATTDFTHIIGLTGWLFGMAVPANSRFADFRAMVAYAKANPGKVTYSTSGIATTNHLAMEQIAEREGIELLHVPFRGSNEGVTAALGGQVDMVADSSAWAPQVDAGQMRLLSVWSAERAPRFPTVPTLKELGHDMVVTSNYGISGPPRMDSGVVRVLHDVFKDALMGAENTRVREQFDMPLVYLSTEQYTDFIRARVDQERAIINRLGIRME